MDFVINENDMKKIISAECQEIATQILSESQQNIIDNGTSDEGTLLKSGGVTLGSTESSVVYDAPHAEPIEYGANPHFPPVDALKGWVRRKLGITGEKNITNTAYAIAKSISDNGLEAQPYVEPAITSVKTSYEGVR